MEIAKAKNATFILELNSETSQSDSSQVPNQPGLLVESIRNTYQLSSYCGHN